MQDKQSVENDILGRTKSMCKRCVKHMEVWNYMVQRKNFTLIDRIWQSTKYRWQKPAEMLSNSSSSSSMTMTDSRRTETKPEVSGKARGYNCTDNRDCLGSHRDGYPGSPWLTSSNLSRKPARGTAIESQNQLATLKTYEQHKAEPWNPQELSRLVPASSTGRAIKSQEGLHGLAQAHFPIPSPTTLSLFPPYFPKLVFSSVKRPPLLCFRGFAHPGPFSWNIRYFVQFCDLFYCKVSDRNITRSDSPPTTTL